MSNYAKFTGTIIDDRTGQSVASTVASIYYSFSAMTPTTTNNVPIGSTSSVKSLGSTQKMIFGTLKSIASGYSFVSFDISLTRSRNGAAIASQSFSSDPTGNLNSYWDLTSALNNSEATSTYPAIFNVTLHVRSTPPTYTLTYNANNGSGAPASQSFQDGTSVTISTVQPTRSGYTFLGWARSASATSKEYAPGSTQRFSSNTTLYAVWEKIVAVSVVVTFNANGGYCGTTSKTVTQGEPYGELPAVYYNGHVFSGWYLGSTRITGSTVVTSTTNHTLTAKWSVPQAGFISFNANGGSGAPAGIAIETGRTTQIPKTRPEKSGYIFGGWATSADAKSAEYFAGKAYSFQSTSITLYALWVTPAGITSSSSGYTQRRLLIAGPDVIATGLPDGVMVLPSLDGYLFYSRIAWLNSDGTYSDYYTVLGAILYANYGKVYLSGTIGDATPSLVSGVTDNSYELIALTADPVVKHGYGHLISIGIDTGKLEQEGLELYGWFVGTSETGSTEAVRRSTDGYLHYGDVWTDKFSRDAAPAAEGSTGTALARHIIAPLVRYKRIVVAFHVPGGSVSPSYKFVNYSKTYGSLPTPVVHSSTFKGWFLANGTKVTSATVVSTREDHVLYASFDVTTWSIRFCDPTGTNADVTREFTVGVAARLPKISDDLGWVIPTGMTLSAADAWSTLPGGEGTVYANNATVQDLAQPGRMIFLYANFQSPNVTIIFNAGDGTSSETTRSVAKGSRIGPLPTATHGSKSFKGWKTSAGDIIDSTFVVKGSITLIAVYESLPAFDWWEVVTY